jgi:hypothetical protein
MQKRGEEFENLIRTPTREITAYNPVIFKNLHRDVNELPRSKENC